MVSPWTWRAALCVILGHRWRRWTTVPDEYCDRCFITWNPVMAFAMIAEPGTQYGPCAPMVVAGVKVYCAHEDCRQSRETAAAICLWCNAAIGYLTEYCRDEDHGDRWVHYWCAVDAIERRRLPSAPR